VLKTDEPAGWSSQKEDKDWESLMGEGLFASGFTAAMDSRGAVLAPAMARENATRFARSALFSMSLGSRNRSILIRPETGASSRL